MAAPFSPFLIIRFSFHPAKNATIERQPGIHRIKAENTDRAVSAGSFVSSK
jgi:hypothetical protein